MLTKRIGAAVAVLAASFAVIVIAAPPAGALQEIRIDVDLAHGFAPEATLIQTGTSVVWHNVDTMDYPVVRGAHTVVATTGAFASPEIVPGGSWAFRFLRPGSYAYFCSIHPSLLTATVEVTGPVIEPPALETEVAIVEGSASDTDTWTYDPEDLAGVTGLTVTWRNNGAAVHTVTAEDRSFDSGDIDPGETWKKTFADPVSLVYVCTLHPWMKGTVRIADEGGEAPPPPQRKEDSSPGASTALAQPVRVGGEPVTWNVAVVEPDVADPDSWTYLPAALEANAGDTVVWTNEGVVDHTVTARDGSFDSATLRAGATFGMLAETEGVFDYYCSLHPWMKGSLRVVAAGARSASPDGAIAGRTPPDDRPTAPAGEEAAPAADPTRTRLALAVAGAIALFTLLLLVAPARDAVRRRRATRRALDEAFDRALLEFLRDEVKTPEKL